MGAVTTERGHAHRWVCPECQTSIRAEALDPETAHDALVEVVREHLATIHPGDRVNPHAAVGWLAAAGHQVELWGGPFDGARLWCPPGELPAGVGVHRTADGALVPVRSATAQLLPHVETYTLGETTAARATGRPVRYLYARWTS